MIKNLFIALLGGSGILTCGFAKSADNSEFHLVHSEMTKAMLKTGNASESVSTLMTLELIGSKSLLSEGVLEVREFSLAAMNVKQSSLSGRQLSGRPNGALSLSTKLGARLSYNAETRQIRGSLDGRAHYPHLMRLFPPKLARANDDFESISQPFHVVITIDLDKPLDATLQTPVLSLNGRVKVSLTAIAMPDYDLDPFGLQVNQSLQLKEFWTFARWESVRQLCLQPVSIKTNNFDGDPTGAGWTFGTPQATTHWRKGDVIFQLRNTRVINSATLKTLSESEADSLLSLVDDDDCIEVFFVEGLVPEDLWGGGATFSGGQATAQIISSDEMVPAGIDLNHLGHELGHVMNLKHPGSATATRPAGNTGTIMCPSGWLNDNPDANSTGNKTNTSNPLFRLSIRARGPIPDCTADGDCGPC